MDARGKYPMELEIMSVISEARLQRREGMNLKHR